MNPNPIISLPVKAATALVANRRVKVGTGAKVEYAGASDTAIGTVLQDCDATIVGRDQAAVQLRGTGINYVTYGTSTALTAGDELVGAANGKVTKGASSPIGVALEAATADGDVIRAFLY